MPPGHRMPQGTITAKHGGIIRNTPRTHLLCPRSSADAGIGGEPLYAPADSRGDQGVTAIVTVAVFDSPLPSAAR